MLKAIFFYTTSLFLPKFRSVPFGVGHDVGVCCSAISHGTASTSS